MPVGRTATLVVASALLFGVACGLRGNAPRPESTSLRVETKLFCGRVRPGGGVVSEEDWHAFLTEVVTPRFPRGFTVVDAAGQYLDPATHELTQERTEILWVVHDGDPASNAAIDDIAAAYRQRFDQRAVLRVDTPAAAPR